MSTKSYRVGVFKHERASGRAFYMAYVRDYNPAWDGCCVHPIEAESGKEAKRVAIQEHKERCEIEPAT